MLIDCKNCGNKVIFYDNETEKKCVFCSTIVKKEIVVEPIKKDTKVKKVLTEVNSRVSLEKNYVMSTQDSLNSVLCIESASNVGTGFIINKEGYVITNSHVISAEDFGGIGFLGDGATHCTLKVIADGKAIGLDLTILKIIDPKGIDYIPFKIARESSIDIGDSCYTIGNAKNRGLQFSKGVVSVPYLPATGNIQFELNSDTGNSGGGVMNENHEIIGVLTWDIEDQKSMIVGISNEKLIRFLKNNNIQYKEAK